MRETYYNSGVWPPHAAECPQAPLNCEMTLSWAGGGADISPRYEAPQPKAKRPARRSPVRAFLESVNLVTFASLDRSKLAAS